MLKTQKIITIFLVISVITAGFFFPFQIKEAKADIAGDFTKHCVGDLLFDIGLELGLGNVITKIEEFLSPGSVPSSDANTKAELRRFELKECFRRLKDLAIVAAHNYLKKRLLDRLVDQTVQWIQNGDEPRFVSDFDEFLKDAHQAAVGDTLRDIGLAKLCDGTFGAKLELTLGKREPRKLTRDVTCTLDQVVGNINAFRNDFQKGGWLGIQEAANPRNNIFGLKLMVVDRTIREISIKQETTKAEVAATGIKPQKKCLEYTLLDKKTDAILRPGDFHPIGSGGSDMLVGLNPTPANADGTPPSLYDVAINSGRAYWRCSNEQIITPANTIAAIIAKTGGLDYDYILNSEDVSSYFSVISDALINRLTTETGKGLRGLFKGGGSPSRGDAGYRNTDYIDSNTATAIQNYEGTLTENYELSPATITASKDGMLAAIAKATSSIANAGINLNTATPKRLELLHLLSNTALKPGWGLIQCINHIANVHSPFTYASDPPIGPDVQSTYDSYNTGGANAQIITSLTNQIAPLNTSANTLKTQVTNAVTSADITALIPKVNSLLTDAKSLETNSQSILNGLVELVATATNQRRDCNDFDSEFDS
ncbi:MAG: hypothetical protein QMD65_00310 [Patescibacteria group bacterium]|nr:hypothetical protein [Patescibacteria group bacterium]